MTTDEVAKVALLARLRLNDQERQRYAEQLSLILEFIAQLGELDTEGVEPLAHGVDRTNVFREDKAYPALDREKALANAPKRSMQGFLVPAVLD
ncbi:MAG: Asp-tRNA(Asn)/Glu-tRNA(Gln) amidotransferase subunit GatC [Planctomycetota bacterium]|jgi:aspartyl-tRNA(Asn)/glutamyl-tRNA(Gln) amidotransferase subunit C|nr:Asp-tRNA(Asn)/Glu-tRNA(Gln) amidotransferase subunit GatC [Planctomycetota bacterium]RLT12437.1 MAG: Asp-tRNA(Asn)/Glu-tRNA(Gln) amidotransferase subunit GatC [Planctomycetota bacterium]